MKRIGKKSTAVFRSAVIAVLITALALLTAPLGKLTRARAENSEPTAVSDVQSDSNQGIALTADTATTMSFTLRIIYYRPGGDYTGWNMWIWGAGGGGDYTSNANDSKGMFIDEAVLNDKNCVWLDIDITNAKPDGDNIIGMKVRYSSGANWWAEECTNMYLPIDKVVEGDITEIYIVQDIDKIYYDMDEALSDKITSAVFTETLGVTSVNITTNSKITDNCKFEIHDSDDNVKGTLDCSSVGVYNNSFAATIPFTGSVDFGEEYTVVDMGNVFTESAVVLKHKLYDTQNFIDNYTYNGDDLGVTYSSTSSTFKVWTPVATDIKLNVYASDTANTPDVYDMTRGEKGVWTATVNDDLNGYYYTYSATVNGTVNEVVDPYARSGGKNGKRGMILDLDATDPTGWATQQNPTLASNSQAVIYEAQLRDLTIHESSNVSAANRGKFLGLTEKNKTEGKTPLEYIKELGVTTVHFQPIFDFASVDESFTTATYNANGQYNWGYDPLNYNMPEGSYSSNPSDGATRVNEMKQMVMALHNEGIQVVMDVVYNHVANAGTSNFEALMPGYYFRINDSGAFFNGSGCGNETASERAMFRKFMIDSVVYWTEEYKIDGFRFDLMGLHDIETMNLLYDAVAAKNEDTIIYGEPWTGGTSGLADHKAAIQKHADQMPNIAVFNDIIRDGLKGSVFDMLDTGLVSGKRTDAAVYVGAVGGTSVLPAADYKTLGTDKTYFALNPTQSVNYVACHDNSTLWDKLNASVNADESTLKSMNRLAAASVLTSQGASFFLAGEELLRSKPTTTGNAYDNRPSKYKTNPSYVFSDNSYKSPDSVNAIDWSNATKNADMVEYYKGLIGIKKTFPMFQITKRSDLATCVKFKDDNLIDGVAVYAVKDPAADSNEYAVVILNSLDKAQTVGVPQGNYSIYVKDDKATADKDNPLATISGNTCTVAARSAIVMTATLDENSIPNWSYSIAEFIEDSDNLGLILGLSIGIPVCLLLICGIVFGLLFFKKKGGKGNTDSDNGDKADSDGESEAPAEEQPSEEQPAESGEEPAEPTNGDNE